MRPPSQETQEAGQALLEMVGVSKLFGQKFALDNASLRMGPGQVHALLGHNGSGKSTLIKILAGLYAADAGQVLVSGRPIPISRHGAAYAAGVRFVHQDLGLVEDMDAVDNIALGTGYAVRSSRLIDWRRATIETRRRLEPLGINLDVRRPVGSLRPAQRTAVAIARVLGDFPAHAHVLVLDEPTASMPAAEAELLFAAIRRIADAGVSVLYVTHHLDEVPRLADVATVLRSGRVVATVRAADKSHHDLTELVLGTTLANLTTSAPPRAGRSKAAVPVLAVDNLSSDEIERVSLNAYTGEIVGVAGLDGSGRSALLPALGGALPRSGRVSVAAAPLASASLRQAGRAGVVFVPADRLRNVLFPDLSVRENLTIGSTRTRGHSGVLRHGAERSDVSQWLDRLRVQPADGQAPILTLSGGNQQKVSIGRALRREPTVLLLDEPTQGVDVGARASIYQLIRDAARGACVVISSSDADELASLCTRVIVMVRGKVVAQLSGEQMSAESIEAALLSQPAATGKAPDVD